MPRKTEKSHLGDIRKSASANELDSIMKVSMNRSARFIIIVIYSQEVTEWVLLSEADLSQPPILVDVDGPSSVKSNKSETLSHSVHKLLYQDR